MAITLLFMLPQGSLAGPTLTVRMADGGSLAASIDQLRSLPRPPHSFIRLQVLTADNAVVPCEEYELQLDSDAKRAFSLGQCSPDTHTTDLILFDPHYLYTHEGGLAQPIRPLIAAIRRPPPPPPPPPPLPPPPPVSTCWALLRPTLIDPENGMPRELNPLKLVPDVLVEPKNAVVERIAFNRGWLIRVREDSGIREVEYALAPWSVTSTGRRGSGPPKPHATVPANVVRTRLALHCGEDSLGPWVWPEPVRVPRRLVVNTPDAQSVTLRRWPGDGALKAERNLGPLMFVLGNLTWLISIPVIGTGAGDRGVLAAGIGMLGGGLASSIGGYFMYLAGSRRLAVRYGSVTVTPSTRE